jgi:hypothetical protein
MTESRLNKFKSVVLMFVAGCSGYLYGIHHPATASIVAICAIIVWATDSAPVEAFTTTGPWLSEEVDTTLYRVGPNSVYNFEVEAAVNAYPDCQEDK